MVVISSRIMYFCRLKNGRDSILLLFTDTIFFLVTIFYICSTSYTLPSLKKEEESGMRVDGSYSQIKYPIKEHDHIMDPFLFVCLFVAAKSMAYRTRAPVKQLVTNIYG